MKSALLTTSELKDRGWTKTLIRRFLPTADATEPNPKYPNAGHPMKLYQLKRVEAAEATDEFRAASILSMKRKESAQKGVLTKEAKMQDYVDNLIVEVPHLEKEELIGKARKNFLSLDVPDSDSMTTERICVNYLRHCLTSYENVLDSIAGKTGCQDAYFEIKEMVLQEIAATYDWLNQECDRQLDKLKHQRNASL